MTQEIGIKKVYFLGDKIVKRQIYYCFDCLVPGTVDDVTATVVDHDTITITWRPPKTPNGRVIQYNITYNTADDNSSRSVTTDGELTVDIDNLTPNTTYYIFVTAKTSKGFGRQGKTVNATTRK